MSVPRREVVTHVQRSIEFDEAHAEVVDAVPVTVTAGDINIASRVGTDAGAGHPDAAKLPGASVNPGSHLAERNRIVSKNPARFQVTLRAERKIHQAVGQE